MDLGFCYINGTGTEKNEAEGFKLVKEAADGGNNKALLFLSIYYFNGQGVEKNTKKAAEYFTQAAKNNVPEALGYLEKCNNPSAPSTPAQSSTPVASSASADELLKTGIDYAYGRNGKSKDESKAFSLYMQASELGNAEAIARMLRYGVGVKTDMAKAIEFYKKAANVGHKKAADGCKAD